MAQYRVGKWKEALKALEKCEKLPSQHDAAAWFVRATAHWQLGHKHEARRWYDKAVERMEADRPYQQAELNRFRAEAGKLLGVSEKSPIDNEVQRE